VHHSITQLLHLVHSIVTMQSMSETQLTAIEIKLAYMEDELATLSELVIKQAKELELLKASKGELEERLSHLEGDVPSQRPPHY